MKLRAGLQEAGLLKASVFLVLAAIVLIDVLALTFAAMSGPKDAPPAVIVPGIDTNATGTTNLTGLSNLTGPANVASNDSAHKLRIVSGGGASPTPDEPTHSADTSMVIDQAADKTPRHIAFAFQPNVSGITDFTAYWTVPWGPHYDGGPRHTIFLWTGIQQGSSGLIQSVLEWDHDDTGRYWTLACWLVNARDQSYDVSPRIYAYPGDRIKAELRYEADAANPGRKVWHIIITDETHDSSTELIDRDGAVDTNRDLTVFSGVLEGIGPVTDGDDLPGDVTFDDITYRDENGVDMPVSLTGYVNPKYGHVAVEYQDGPAGTPVIIRTNYSV